MKDEKRSLKRSKKIAALTVIISIIAIAAIWFVDWMEPLRIGVILDLNSGETAESVEKDLEKRYTSVDGRKLEWTVQTVDEETDISAIYHQFQKADISVIIGGETIREGYALRELAQRFQIPTFAVYAPDDSLTGKQDAYYRLSRSVLKLSSDLGGWMTEEGFGRVCLIVTTNSAIDTIAFSGLLSGCLKGGLTVWSPAQSSTGEMTNGDSVVRFGDWNQIRESVRKSGFDCVIVMMDTPAVREALGMLKGAGEAKTFALPVGSDSVVECSSDIDATMQTVLKETDISRRLETIFEIVFEAARHSGVKRQQMVRYLGVARVYETSVGSVRIDEFGDAYPGAMRIVGSNITDRAVIKTK